MEFNSQFVQFIVIKTGHFSHTYSNYCDLSNFTQDIEKKKILSLSRHYLYLC